MSRSYADRKKLFQSTAESAPVTDGAVKRQLSLAAGTEAFQNRDPIYHLTESFRQTFDMMGQQRAKGEQPDLDAARAVYMRDETPGLSGFDEAESSKEEPKHTPMTGFSEEFLHKTDMTSAYQPRNQGSQQRLMDRFADVTFQRGNLSAAIVRGTGKMMLFSCLNRTVGQEHTKQLKERMLFQSNSSHRYIPGRREDIAVTNRGFAESAVGLVVDVLKDARQVLDSLTDMAEGKAGEDGLGTMQKQYPFLTDARERALLEEYDARLAQLKGPGHEEERTILSRAKEKAEAIIQKKAQMKRDFLQRLRQLSHSAATAQAIFSQEDFLQQAAQQLITEEPDDLPPDAPDGDDDNNENQNNKRDDRKVKKDRKK